MRDLIFGLAKMPGSEEFCAGKVRDTFANPDLQFDKGFVASIVNTVKSFDLNNPGIMDPNTQEFTKTYQEKLQQFFNAMPEEDKNKFIRAVSQVTQIKENELKALVKSPNLDIIVNMANNIAERTEELYQGEDKSKLKLSADIGGQLKLTLLSFQLANIINKTGVDLSTIASIQRENIVDGISKSIISKETTLYLTHDHYNKLTSENKNKISGLTIISAEQGAKDMGNDDLMLVTVKTPENQIICEKHENAVIIPIIGTVLKPARDLLSVNLQNKEKFIELLCRSTINQVAGILEPDIEKNQSIKIMPKINTNQPLSEEQRVAAIREQMEKFNNEFNKGIADDPFSFGATEENSFKNNNITNKQEKTPEIQITQSKTSKLSSKDKELKGSNSFKDILAESGITNPLKKRTNKSKSVNDGVFVKEPSNKLKPSENKEEKTNNKDTLKESFQEKMKNASRRKSDSSGKGSPF